MSHYDQHQAPSAVYPPPPPNGYPPAGQGYPPPPADGYPTATAYVAPPPAGYLMKDGAGYGYPQQGPVETKSRGDDDGFWKGCCAAMCCCCCLDMCF